MRGLKRVDTTKLAEYQLYHNFVRPHEGIKNMAPAEKCGVRIDGNNKWLILIENASKAKLNVKDSD